MHEIFANEREATKHHYTTSDKILILEKEKVH